MISLVSDTETKPTAGMRSAIAAAEVGDEQRGEDPTVNRLLERTAELLGKEAALWLPTGTMCNLVAIRTHTKPGDAIVADHLAHIVRAESGGPAMASGVMVEPIVTANGIYSGAQLEAALALLNTASYPYGAPARLACVEQTHNFGGGSVWSVEQLRDVFTAAKRHGLAVHMDGARLLNASIAANRAPAEFAAFTDSLWIDFTKGLGAPVGAVLAGTAAFIADARRYKHVFAGAMRQAGIVAAGCLYALDHHVKRLADDHANAKALAAGLASIPGVELLTPAPETNIVFFDVSKCGIDNASFVNAMRDRGVKLGIVRGGIRAVTHLDVSTHDIEKAIATAKTILAEQ